MATRIKYLDQVDPNKPMLSQNFIDEYIKSGLDTFEQFEQQNPHVQKYTTGVADDIKTGIDFANSYFSSEGYKEKASKVSLANGQPLGTKNPIPKKVQVGLSPESIAKSYAIRELGYINMGVVPTEHLNSSGTAAHEYAHLNPLFNTQSGTVGEGNLASPHYGMDYTNLPSNYVELLTPTVETHGHDAELNEQYSDFISSLAELQKSGIFDARKAGSVFTKEHLNTYRQTEAGQKDRFLQYHTDDDKLIKAYNEIASNSGSAFQKQDGLYYAKSGGKFSRIRDYIKRKNNFK